MNTPRDPHDSLENRLRTDARALRVAPPECLEQRVSAAVWREADAARHGNTAAAAPRRRRRWFLSPALAGFVTSACAVAVVVVWHGERTRRTEEIRYLVETVQALPARLAATELPSPRRINAPDPLARELASVREDARSALDFLAANFLPSDALAPAEGASDALPPQKS